MGHHRALTLVRARLISKSTSTPTWTSVTMRTSAWDVVQSASVIELYRVVLNADECGRSAQTNQSIIKNLSTACSPK